TRKLLHGRALFSTANLGRVEQGEDGGGIDPGEGIDDTDDIQAGEALPRVGRGHGEHFHPGGETGLDPDVGVLDDKAGGGAAFYRGGGREEDVGKWFSPGDVFGTDVAGAEKAVQPGRGEASFDVFPRGRGSEGKGDPGIGEGLE